MQLQQAPDIYESQIESKTSDLTEYYCILISMQNQLHQFTLEIQQILEFLNLKSLKYFLTFTDLYQHAQNQFSSSILS